jgi:hypothetical protein
MYVHVFLKNVLLKYACTHAGTKLLPALYCENSQRILSFHRISIAREICTYIGGKVEYFSKDLWMNVKITSLNEKMPYLNTVNMGLFVCLVLSYTNTV